MEQETQTKFKPKAVTGFIEFIREQGVVGLAIGFILGSAVGKVVSSLVTDIIQPFVGLALGRGEALASLHVSIHGAVIRYGNFIAIVLDFIIVAAVVYFGFKALGLDRLDKKKE